MNDKPNTFVEQLRQTTINNVAQQIALLYADDNMFTGKLELNFCKGKLMDINETKRTKFED